MIVVLTKWLCVSMELISKSSLECYHLLLAFLTLVYQPLSTEQAQLSLSAFLYVSGLQEKAGSLSSAARAARCWQNINSFTIAAYIIPHIVIAHAYMLVPTAVESVQ